MAKLSHPTVLSGKRAHNVSVFPLYGVPITQVPLFELDLEKAHPVRITRETIRATQSAPATPEAKRGLSNVQEIDFAQLPHGSAALVASGNVLVTSLGVELTNVNDPVFKQAHDEFMTAFTAAGGMTQLAERFVMNMLNGALLFRNRIGEHIRCAVRAGALTVELSETQLSVAGSLSMVDITDAAIRDQVKALVTLWASALTGERSSLRVDVRAYVVMGEQQEVYPSQEFGTDEDKKDKEKGKGKGRRLASAVRNDGVLQAAFHGRKICNALRTIDTWYPGAYRALPVEPYGVDQAAQAALRTKGTDFYSLMLRMGEFTEELKAGKISADALFVAAVFLRGGVFSKKAD